jgi:hypothetical protein
MTCQANISMKSSAKSSRLGKIPISVEDVVLGNYTSSFPRSARFTTGTRGQRST